MQNKDILRHTKTQSFHFRLPFQKKLRESMEQWNPMKTNTNDMDY